MDGQERRGRILVVDDEEPVRRALAQILEDEGYEVVGAESAEEGIKRARRGAGSGGQWPRRAARGPGADVPT